jgi:CysZ protein
MMAAAARAIAQLRDPALFGVLVISVAGAAIVLLGAWFGVAALLAHVTMFKIDWLDWLTRIVLGLGAIFATLALFGSIAAMIASLFIGRVAQAVENRYYPGLPPARRQSGSEQLRTGVSFLLSSIALNLLALPFYALWGANVPIFLAVNGYLMGREYFELVAARRLDPPGVTRLRRAHTPQLFVAGVAIAAFAAVPFANLLTPVLATAFMLHLFYRTLGGLNWASGVGLADTGISVIRR